MGFVSSSSMMSVISSISQGGKIGTIFKPLIATSSVYLHRYLTRAMHSQKPKERTDVCPWQMIVFSVAFLFRQTFSLEEFHLILVFKHEACILVKGHDKQENCGLLKSVWAWGHSSVVKSMLTVFPVNLDLIPSIHMVAHNHMVSVTPVPSDPTFSSGLLAHHACM